MTGDRYDVYGLDPIPTLLLSLGTTAFACLAVGLAVHYYYRELKGHEQQLLDAVWELCDAHGWRGELGARLFRLLELEREDPIPDATDDGERYWPPGDPLPSRPGPVAGFEPKEPVILDEISRPGWTPAKPAPSGRHRKRQIMPDDLHDVFTDEEERDES